MAKLDGWKRGWTVCLLCVATTIAAYGQKLTTMVIFDGTSGEYPNAPLVQGIDGNLYGTTERGGAYGWGTFFQMTPSGLLTTLYNFCAQLNCTDGAAPGPLILGTDGNFYGTTGAGGRQRQQCEPALGCGTMFRITLAGKLTTLYRFCAKTQCMDGFAPEGALVQGVDGNLYGATIGGGSYTQCDPPYGGCGTVFKFDPNGLTTLHSFDRSDGENPDTGLVQAPNGVFYGTTPYLGEGSGEGTLYSVTSDGTFNTLHSFEGSDGSEPSSLTLGTRSGVLFGATEAGGTSGQGTLFTTTLQGLVTTIYSFDSYSVPSTPIEGNDRKFYGTTAYGGTNSCPFVHCGTIFLVSSKGILTTLYNFDGSDGYAPGTLLQSTTGNFYGTTAEGGDFTCPNGPNGCGTAFRLDEGLDSFIAFVQAAGRIGKTARILGQGFTGTTGVSFNGTPAAFTVTSDTFLAATVPDGATTGYVTVTTSSGKLTSNMPFHVLP